MPSMEKLRYVGPFFIVIIAVISTVKGQESACPIEQDKADAHGQVCDHSRDCTPDTGCGGKRACSCDGFCGYKCIRVLRNPYCLEELQVPHHAQVQYDSDSGKHQVFNATATFTCDPGSVLIGGNLTRTCRGDGTWSGFEPQCYNEEEDCPRKERAITRNNRVCQPSCSLSPLLGNQCNASEQCVCDGVCGMTCVTTAQENYCEPHPVIDHVSTAFEPVENRQFGTVATSSCEAGYEKKSGDESRTCGGDGLWSGEDMACNRSISCLANSRPVVENTNIEDDKEVYKPGEFLVYSCNYGYYRIGLAFISCKDDGLWQEPELTCRLKSCPTPPIPENGGRRGSVFSFGSTVTITCNTGYRMIGLPYRTCQGDQVWSGYEPECKPVECPKLYPPANGIIFPEERYTYQTRVEVECNEGFIHRGSVTKQCQANREWSGEPFSCIPIDCGDPGTPINGEKIGDTYGHGAVLYFRCLEGFEMKGSRSTRCTDTEEWTLPIPECKRSCILPQAPPNSYYLNVRSGAVINDGQSVTIRCHNSGYSLTPNEPWTCDNGRALRDIQCIETPCPILEDTSSTSYQYNPLAEANSEQVASRTVAEINCNPGYRLKSQYRSASPPSCLKGHWINFHSNPCEAEPCPRLNEFSNGYISYSPSTSLQLVRHDTTASYICNDRYELSGATTKTKCVKGEWTSREQPICIPEPCDALYIQHGAVEYDPPLAEGASHYADSTEATYTCRPGYQLDRPFSTIRRCDRGRWSLPTPQCIPSPCPALQLNDETDLTVDYLSVHFIGPFISSGTQAVYRCKDGFRGNSATTTCNQGIWSNTELPMCTPAPCPKFTEGFEVTYSDDSNEAEVQHLTKANITDCPQGYNLTSVGHMLCRFGSWEGEDMCKPVVCPADVVNHAAIIYMKNDQILDIPEPYHSVERQYICEEGYRMVGINASQCNGGVWSANAPTCEASPCRGIEKGHHVKSVDYGTSRQSYPIGTIATIVCDEKSHIQGTNQATCLRGSWSPNIPICTANSLANGKDVIQSSTTGINRAELAVDGVYDTTFCTHTVNSFEPWWRVDLGNQYSITSVTVVIFNDVSVCRNCKMRIKGAVVRVSRTWDPNEAYTYTQCGSPVTEEQAKVANPINFNCASNTIGRYVSVQSVGKTERLQLCEVEVFGTLVEECVVPSILDGSVVNYQPNQLVLRPNQLVLRNTYIYYRCDDNYERAGTYSNRCLQTGEWQNNHATCVPRACTVNDIWYGEFITLSPATHGTVITFDCNNGYERATEDDIVCHYGFLKASLNLNGQPVSYTHLCVISPCRIPDLLSHVKIVNGEFPLNGKVPHGQYISFECDPGYTMEGDGKGIVCEQGRFRYGDDISGLRCLPKPCGTPPSIEHGEFKLLSGGGYQEGGLIQYSCDVGYILEGQSLSQCTGQQWRSEPPVPRCVDDPNYLPDGESCPIPSLGEGRIFYAGREVYPPSYTSVPHSSSVYVTCTNQAVDVSFTNECNDGEWSIPMDSCNRQAYSECSVPSVPEGSIYFSENKLFPPTSVHNMAMVVLRCNGDNRVFNSRCENGRWSKSLQSCIKTSCPRPNTPTYVFQFINDTSVELREDPRREFPVGTFIVSRCQDPGKYKFHPTESVQRRCTTSGWTGQQPTCTWSSVRILIKGRNHRQSHNNGTLVIQANLGTVKIICSARKRTQQEPYPTFIAQHISRVARSYGTTDNYLLVSFDLGPAQLSDSGTFTCRYRDRADEHSLKVQVRDVSCDDPGPFLNGVQTGFSYILTRKVSFTCNDGYTLEGPSTITCNLGGWSGKIPTCRSDQCPEYVLPDNMREFAGSGFHTEAIRMFTCQSGFTFGSGVYQVTVQCMENGQWSPEIPSCSAMVNAATSSPRIDPCSTVQCELWEVCGVINNEGQCYCTKPSDCPFTKSAEEMVCGSDGREYDSYCHLKATSCFFGRSITVSNNGTCPEEVDNGYSLDYSLSSTNDEYSMLIDYGFTTEQVPSNGDVNPTAQILPNHDPTTLLQELKQDLTTASDNP